MTVRVRRHLPGELRTGEEQRRYRKLRVSARARLTGQRPGFRYATEGRNRHGIRKGDRIGAYVELRGDRARRFREARPYLSRSERTKCGVARGAWSKLGARGLVRIEGPVLAWAALGERYHDRYARLTTVEVEVG